MASIADLTAEARAFVTERDWSRYHSPRNLAMALSVEAGELLELFLWDTDDGPQPATEARAAKVGDEAADVLLCLLNFCDRAGVDLEAAFAAKLAKARAKYPVERVRGKALKYDEYPERRFVTEAPAGLHPDAAALLAEVGLPAAVAEGTDWRVVCLEGGLVPEGDGFVVAAARHGRFVVGPEGDVRGVGEAGAWVVATSLAAFAAALERLATDLRGS